MGQRLCKADVPEKFLTPQQGSLALEPLELRKIRKLVSRGKLAPFYPGLDDSVDAHELDECPICFLYHKTMNRSKCCGQRICSECFIQIKKKSGTYLGSVCPFCKSPGFNVEVCGAKSEQEKTQERLDEQRLLEHRLKERLAQGPEVPQPMDQNTSTLAPESAFEPSPPLHFPPVPQVAHQGPEEEVNERRATEDVEANNNVSRERLMSTDERQQESEGDSVGPARDDYREEFAALGRTLTNRDMLQCAEYLGVFPEDLGMPVDDFNELLLEQAIIRSMMDNNQSRHQQERQRPSQPSSNCIPNNQESHSDDQAEVGSWASDTIEPTLESASNGYVSAIATSGLDLVHGDEESHGRSDSHCSVAAQDKEDYIWEVGCSDKCVPSSSSGPSNADRLQPTEYSLLMKTQDFGIELVSRQASCPEQIEGRDGLWFNDVAQGAAKRLQDSSQPSVSASVTEASTSGSKVDEGDDSMPSSSSGPMSGVPIRSASCPLAGSERDEIGGFGDLIASLAMSGEVNLDQKTVQLEMVFVHLNQPNIQRIEEENNPQPPQQILDDAMDQYLAGGNDDIQDLFDVEDSESEDASMPNSDRVSLASSQRDLEESSSLSAASEVFLASGDYHNLETKQITANAVDRTASKTVAFSNPDGSVVLVTVPDEHPTIPAGSTSNSSRHGRQSLPVVDCTSAIPLTEENIGGYLANAVVQRVIVENEGRAVPDTKQCDQGDVFLSQKTDEEFSERIEESDQQTRHAIQGASQTEGGPSS